MTDHMRGNPITVQIVAPTTVIVQPDIRIERFPLLATIRTCHHVGEGRDLLRFLRWSVDQVVPGKPTSRGIRARKLQLGSESVTLPHEAIASADQMRKPSIMRSKPLTSSSITSGLARPLGLRVPASRDREVALPAHSARSGRT